MSALDHGIPLCNLNDILNLVGCTCPNCKVIHSNNTVCSLFLREISTTYEKKKSYLLRRPTCTYRHFMQLQSQTNVIGSGHLSLILGRLGMC